MGTIQEKVIEVNSPIRVSVSVNSPFEIFSDEQWNWISGNCDPYEYSELDEIYTYLSGDRQRNELPDHLQALSDDELQQEYNKRFPILFGKTLESLGKQFVNGEIVMNINYK